jgi:hypothetical protein
MLWRPGGDEMSQEWKEWEKQFWSNIGLAEILRFGCAVVLWLSAGMVLGGLLRSAFLILVFFAVLFAYILLSFFWKPIYLVHRKILGKGNLPSEPMPRSRMKLPRQARQARPWWSYLPGLWFTLLSLILLYLILNK